MLKFRVLGAAAAGLLTTLTLGGFAGIGSIAAAHASGGATVVVADNEEPPTLNPLEDSTAVGVDITSTVLDSALNYLPTSWPKSNNMKYHYVLDLLSSMPTVQIQGAPGPNAQVTITMHFNPKIKWSDGVPLTSKDFWFTWQAIMNPNTGAYTAGWNQITSIATPNPQTAIIHMKGTYAPWEVTFMQTTLMPYHLLKNDLKNIANVYNNSILATGPYKISKWVHGQYMELVPNPLYAGQDGPRPSVKTIIFKFVSDQNTMVDQMITKEVQVSDQLQLTNALYSEFHSIPSTKIYNVMGAEMQQYTWNLKDGVAGDPAVRQAFFLALNRQQLSKVLTNGRYAVPNNVDLTPFSWAWDSHLPYVTQNIAKAKSILENDGWTMQNGYFYKNGQELVLDITTTSGNELRAQIMQVVTQQVAAAGIKVVANYVSPSALFASYQQGGLLATGQFQVAQFAWVFNSPDPDDSFLWNSVLGAPQAGGGDYGRYFNPTINKLTNEELYSMSQTQRTQIYQQIESILLKDLPMIPLFVASENAAYNTGVQGILANPQGYTMWNSNYWHYTVQ